jgi:hypothetical protein
MPEYVFGDQVVRRKNLYRPCVMTEEFERLQAEGDHAGIARLLKATAWADNFTNTEWPIVLERFAETEEELQKVRNAPARSRLKRKAAGWLVALQRMALLNPELFEGVADLAGRTYREQIQDEPVVRLVWDGRLFVDGDDLEVGGRVQWRPEDAS